MSVQWLRAHLSALTTVWLFCQLLSLFALAPRYCCPAHVHASTSGSGAHHAESAAHHGDATEHCSASAGADTCPMTGANGEACPMHRAGPPQSPASGSTAASPAADPDCVMRATCEGPVAALASLIWIPGIFDEAESRPADLVAPLEPAAPASGTSFIRPIDLPPPRA